MITRIRIMRFIKSPFYCDAQVPCIPTVDHLSVATATTHTKSPVVDPEALVIPTPSEPSVPFNRMVLPAVTSRIRSWAVPLSIKHRESPNTARGSIQVPAPVAINMVPRTPTAVIAAASIPSASELISTPPWIVPVDTKFKAVVISVTPVPLDIATLFAVASKLNIKFSLFVFPRPASVIAPPEALIIPPVVPKAKLVLTTGVAIVGEVKLGDTLRVQLVPSE
jgi:hypothetical protein